MEKSFSKNNNPVYFRFIELAKEKMQETVYPLKGKAAICCIQIVLKMAREEYLILGEERLKVILNVNALQRRQKKTSEMTREIR